MTPLRKLLRLTETTHSVPSEKAKLNQAIFRIGWVTALATAALLLLLGRGSATTQASGLGQKLASTTRYVAGKFGWALTGTINGMVFRDFNGNGAFTSATELGVDGVIVTVYDGAGNRCTATTVNGSYSINTASCTATPATNLTAGPYRVEFTNIPAGFESSAVGTNSGSTVQFINEGGGQADLALHVPSEYSQNQPDAVTSSYVNGDTNLTTPTVGDAEAGALDVLVKFPYQPVAASGANTYLAKGSAMGMTWGLAYQRASKSIFSGAFMKRHSSFGPNGPGAIYKTDVSGATPTTSVFLDLDAAPFNYNFGADPHSGLPVNPATPNHDPNSFDAVGKVGIGDVDLSEDEKTLWLVNLQDRNLYEIAVGNPAVAPSSTSAIKRHDIAAGLSVVNSTGCANSVFRPWALAVKGGYVYVGGVCQDASRAWIIRHNAAGATGSFEYVYDFSLAYTKGPVTRDGAAVDNGDWRPWRATWAEIVNPAPGAAVLNETVQPQPILSDIEFDLNGSLMLGFIDRMGHQGGYNNYGTDTASTTTYLTASGGELLRVCRVGNSYVMQGSAGCANNQSNNQGPGGGEYYWFDFHNQVHEEVVVGGLAFRPGSGSVLATRHGGGGGVRWFSNASGSADDDYSIYGFGDLGTAGKAAGLGDVEYLRDQTPVEVGNRLWMDANNNGVQDPNEMALANVTVRLYKVGNAAALATARTDASGQFIFSNDPRGYAAAGNSDPNNTASNGGFNSGDVQGGRASTASHRYGLLGLMPGMSYEIRFDNAADYTGTNPLAGKTPTLKDASGNTVDQRDSDVMLPTPGAPVGAGNYPFIAVTLGADDAGRNNHTLDAGFHVCAPITISPSTLTNVGVGQTVNQQLTATGGTAPYAFTVAQGSSLPPTLMLSGTGLLSGTVTSGAATTFTVVVTDNDGCTGTITYTFAPTCPTITVNAPPNGTVGVAYNHTLTANGGSGTYTFAVNGSLPAGLMLNGAVISGTPTSGAPVNFSITATDSSSRCTGTTNFTITPACNATYTVSPTTLPTATVGSFFSQQFTVPNANAQVTLTWSTTGTLPDGLTFNPANATLSGTPTSTTARTFTVRATYGGTCAASQQFTLQPICNTNLAVNPATLTLTVGTAVNQQFTVANAATGNITWLQTGQLPAGLTFDVTTGILSGTPTNATQVTFRIRGTDSNGCMAARDYTVAAAPLLNLGNLVWKDLNNNGIRDNGEPGIDGVQVDLYLDRDNSGGFSSGDSPAIGPATTANGGVYNFTGLQPGRYIVNVPNTNFQGANRLVGCLSSTVTATNPDNDIDNDDNGVDDNNPAVNGIASRAITLSGFGEPTTDGDGNNGNLTLDFGFYTPVSLGNLVWKDLNNNGSRDNGEPGVDTVLVELMRDSDLSGALNGAELTTIVATRVTAGGGLYQFTNLSPGNYFVRIAAANFNGTAALAGCLSSAVTDGTPNNDEDNDDNGIDNAAPGTNGILSGLITLTSGGEPGAAIDGDGTDSNATVDFGFFTPVSLGNLVWKDLDNSGMRNGAEPVINGVKVELFRDVNNNNQLDAGDGAMLAMTTTVNGLYSFTNLTPGNYFVRVAASNFVSGGALFECVSSTVTQPNANSDTDNDDNGIDNADPLANGITSGVITLQAGTEPDSNVDSDGRNANQTIDFGFVSATQSIGNLVWKDTDRNGRRNGNEAGIGGVKLNLYRDNGDNTFNAANDALLAMTTTNGAGNYLFSNLITGRYFVQVDASNFAGGGALSGCISSSGNVNPNTDTEDDDNGSDSLNPATNPPVSGAILLTTNGEPPANVDGDGTNGNNTIDFGFVGFLNLTVSAAAGCVGPGGVLELVTTLTNPLATNQADNSGPEFEVALPASLVAIPNSCTATSGACTVANGGTVRWNGALAANASVTIRYRVQAANNLSASTPVCFTTTAFFDADNNGSNETAASVDNCVQATCPQAGPGEPVPGCSVLIYPVYTSSASNPARGNTRINLTNTSQNQSASMHLFFVDGEYCTVADSFLCLTPNQTTSFLMSDLDPGTTGYLIAVAVDPATGCPAYFNYLIGDEHVKFESGHTANLKAECAQALPGGDFSCDGTNQFATLRFDGVQYSRLPRVVALDSLPSPADGNDTRLYLSRIGGNLAGNAAALGEIFGLAYDDAERSYSFGGVIGTCQLRTQLNGAYPRTSPRLDTLIPSGRTGWLKVWTLNEGALVGAALNHNAAAQANAFNGGHNLHTLRYAESASFQIPLFPGVCR